MEEQNNKNLILAMVLSAAVMIIWFVLFPPPEPTVDLTTPTATETAVTATPAADPAVDAGWQAALVLGMCFISEGAIPFAAKDPLRVIPASIAGGALTGVSMFLAITALHALLLGVVLNRWTAKPLLAVLLVGTAAAAYFASAYTVFLDADMVRNVLHTDAKESRELFAPGMVASTASVSDGTRLTMRSIS